MNENFAVLLKAAVKAEGRNGRACEGRVALCRFGRWHVPSGLRFSPTARRLTFPRAMLILPACRSVCLHALPPARCLSKHQIRVLFFMSVCARSVGLSASLSLSLSVSVYFSLFVCLSPSLSFFLSFSFPISFLVSVSVHLSLPPPPPHVPHSLSLSAISVCLFVSRTVCVLI